jgi:hypothetical protein
MIQTAPADNGNLYMDLGLMRWMPRIPQADTISHIISATNAISSR